MILDKYQINENEEIQNRGYSSTCIVKDSTGKIFFAKWIKGIRKDSTACKLLSDKLRHLKKVKHTSLASINEYQWDEDSLSYCIITDFIKAEPLEDFVHNIKPDVFLCGIQKLVNCLRQLLKSNNITHGDISPANILIDKNFNFYLIDFGISDIASTLSQEQNIVVFSQKFTAPEKWNRDIKKGFPYQSDIYSIGKVIEWFFIENKLNNYLEVENLLDILCANTPSDRADYNILDDKLQRIINSDIFTEKNKVFLEAQGFDSKILKLFLSDINDKNFVPLFNVSNKKGENILTDISTKSYYAHALWVISDKKLIIRSLYKKEDQIVRYDNTIKYGEKLSIPVSYTVEKIYREIFNLTTEFKKIQNQSEISSIYRKKHYSIKKELEFYEKLLNKEIETIQEKSIQLKYKKYIKKSDYEIWFHIEKNKKHNFLGTIKQHIDSSTPPRPVEYEYIVSNSTNKKQMKDPCYFTGISYSFIGSQMILKIKDCEKLDFEKLPKQGYLIENTKKQEEEKNRQLQAIQKVKFNEVQNVNLINYIFNPSELEGMYLDSYSLGNIYQTDAEGNSFKYSTNQNRAIFNALNREPLTVIQGPPGTGKTTVITEIVFQILAKNPNSKILITSQTNDAVDNVLDNLLEKSIPLIRLSGLREPKESLAKHTMERKIEGWKVQVKKKSKRKFEKIKSSFYKEISLEHILIKEIVIILRDNRTWSIKKRSIEKILERIAKDDSRFIDLPWENESDLIDSISIAIGNDKIKDFMNKYYLHKDWLSAISSLNESSNLNQKLVDNIRVMGATTNHIASKKYAKFNFEFDYVIMDESGKATVAESLIPIVLAEKVILVGDHRQLRPMLTANKDVEKWLKKQYNESIDAIDTWDDYINRPSLFEQIITRIDDDFKSQLVMCRRCTEDQVKLISECFYEPLGDEAIKPVKRNKEKEHNLPLKVNSSIVFLNTGHSYESQLDNNRSSYNIISAEIISKLLLKLDKYKDIEKQSIGIISGYKAQLREIKKSINQERISQKLKKIQFNQIEISVIDKFQGLEKDIIIIDLVRTCHDSNLGFLSNSNRINVALSRQKKLIIIIGDYDGITSAPVPRHIQSDTTALQNYLSKLNDEWIINSLEEL